VKTRPGLRLLAAALGGRRRTLLSAAGWSAIEGIPTLLSGLLIARALHDGFLRGSVLIGLSWLGAYLACAVVAAVATGRLYPLLAEIVEPARDFLVGGAVGGTLSRAVAGSIAPVTRPGTGGPGEGVAQAVQQVDTVRNLLSAILRGLRQLVVPLVTAAIGLFLLSPRIAVLVLPWIVIAVGSYLLLLPKMLAAEQSRVTAETALADEAATCLSGLRDLTAGGAVGWATARLGDRAQASAAAERRAGWLSTCRHAVVALGVLGPLISIVVAAAVWVPRGQLTLPVVLGALTYVQNGLAVAVRSVVHTGSVWFLQLGVLMSQLADGTEEIAVGPPAVPRSGAGPAVRLDGVTFAYGAHSEPVIRDLSLTIAEREHLAVIGLSGAGKSTLALLLAGVLVPDRGEIAIGGRPAVPGPRPDVAVVPQEAYVFAGSLRENLVYLRPDADDDTVRAAMSTFGLWPLVDRLGGLDATLGTGGGGLSDGERQRVTLARTWIRRAPVVVLDEATSRLEPGAERSVEDAFTSAGSTLVVIAHRLDSARRADRVLLLDGGRWLVGRHAAVLDQSAVYRRLTDSDADRPYRELADPRGTWGQGSNGGGMNGEPVHAARRRAAHLG
jgi:ABC-type multidrug transport system fused ATPase/permease subunit